jgi:hypothetical protein
MPYSNIIVLSGHIHQEYHHMIGHIPHLSCKGSMYPLPAPGSTTVLAPVPWDPQEPYKGLGYRTVDIHSKPVKFDVTEYSVKGEITK